MATLRIIMLDVGWGDSILIESKDDRGKNYYALVDSNDTSLNRFTLNFLKRRFQTNNVDYRNHKPLFKFVLLSHIHTDHGQGLRYAISEFETENFWYPKSNNWGGLASLLRYAQNSNKVRHHQSIDDQRMLPSLGPVSLKILWPREHGIDDNNENNNSVILQLTLDQVDFLLTGDAEKEVWQEIAAEIPASTSFFKVPHHGSVNGSFDGDQAAWLNDCPQEAKLGISCHVGRFGHPHQAVINLFNQGGHEYLRTDIHYHLIFETNGRETTKHYSH